MEEQRNQFFDEQNDNQKEWEQSHERGFSATPEQLLAKIESLYASGEILNHAPASLGYWGKTVKGDKEATKSLLYGWGCVGVDMLQDAGIVAKSKPAAEEPVMFDV